MDKDELNNIYLLTGIILAILLIISEILGWSKCKANSLTQLYCSFTCHNNTETQP